MNFDTLARTCRKMAFEGKDYEEILHSISYQKLISSEQKELRSLINDFVVQYDLAEQVKGKYKIQMMLGAVALLIGLFILLFTFLKGETSYGIGLAASLIGLYIIKKGYDQFKKPVDFQHIAPEKDSKFRKY